MKTVAFQTLGCKVNYYESEALKGLFRRAGYRVVAFPGPADVYVINTCTVTHLSDRKSRQMVRRARRHNPDAVVVVTGCYAQVSASEVGEIPGVDLVVGTFGREKLPEMVEEAGGARERPLNLVEDYPPEVSFERIPWAPAQGRTRAFLKIEEGCDRYCSFCIIPYARGPVRSLPPGEVRREAGRIASFGYKELVLTGVHLGLYGQDLGGGVTLASLLEELEEVEGIERIRLSSLEPADFTPSLVESVGKCGRLCAHLHIPLQSGDDRILKRMNRPYTTSFYQYLLEELRILLPDLAVSTDIIVGFPGEEEESFERTRRFVRRMAFSRLHVFKYSPRAGTLAAGYPDQVPPPVKEKRSRCLIQLGKELGDQYARRFIGRQMKVLLEKPTGWGAMEGLTENYLRVRVEGLQQESGRIVSVELREWKGDCFRGALVGSGS